MPVGAVVFAAGSVVPYRMIARAGVEIDLGTDYAVYKNFDLGVNLGYLFAGAGLGVPNPQGAFAFRTTLSLKF